MSVSSRRWPSPGLLLCAGLLAGWISGAAAQSYPNKPIRLIVPTAAGAVTDAAARLIAQRMGQLLGETIFVENKAGAGMRIGSEFVARAPADGYTLLYANSVTHGTLPALAKTLSYDPLRDFAPVAGLFWYASYDRLPSVRAGDKRARAH